MKKEIVEVTKNYDDDISKISAYCQINNNEYLFTDLRTAIDITKIGVSENMDFSEDGLTAIKRLYRYQMVDCKGFDLDYCKSTRTKYSFKLINDLYKVLWRGIDDKETTVNSSETIVSAKQNIPRVFPNLRKKQRGRPTVDWSLFLRCSDQELEELSYRVATIGNYMPVPSCEQLILNIFFAERFDRLLHEIKKYYEKGSRHKSFKNTKEFLTWLDLFVDEDGKKSWVVFVQKNFLIGSFVDAEYNIKDFDGTANQLSEMIKIRSIEMIKVFIEKVRKGT